MKTLFTKILTVALFSIAAGVVSVSAQASKPVQSKPAKSKSAAPKSAPSKPVAAKTTAAAQSVPAPAVPAETAPVQPQTEQPLLGEDEPLPFMKGDEQNSPAEPSSSGLILKSIGALMLVIGLLVFGTWSMKKLGFGNKAAKGPNAELGLEVLSTMPMGGGKTLSMVQFGERVLLVGSTAQNFTLLAEHGPAEHSFETAPRSVADLLADDDEGGTFDDEFERAMSQLEGRGVYGGIA